MTDSDSQKSSLVDKLLEQLLAMTESTPIAADPPSNDDVHAAIDESSRIGLSRIVYAGYKALGDYEIPLQHMNILTGINNAGKSTALSTLRILATGLAVAKRKKPESVSTPNGYGTGYHVPTKNLGISLENVHTDLSERDSKVTFSYFNGGELVLWFPLDGGCTLVIGPNSKVSPSTPTAFRKAFATRIIHVPVLGPFEYEEPLLKIETVQSGATTHRACRHFRNYWYHFPENFDRFAALLADTWPGMTISPPERNFGANGLSLSMFCQENRLTRELFWSGFGFQIWCQLLTHVCRATPNDLLVMDEPETYLHPAIQRRLIEVLRGTGAQVVLATHSASIVMAANDNDVIVVEKTSRVATRRKKRAAALAAQLGLSTIPN